MRWGGAHFVRLLTVMVVGVACADDRRDEPLGKITQAIETCSNPVLIASWTPARPGANDAEWFDGHRLLPHPIVFLLPSVAQVDSGGAGSGTATLTLSLGGQVVDRCTYSAGVAGVPVTDFRQPGKKPKRFDLVEPPQYVFAGCESGRSIEELVRADELLFRVEDGDAALGSTTARLELTEPVNACVPIGRLDAPPLDPGRPTRFFDVVRHIVEGPTAVQMGVVANSIPPELASGIRGRVLREDGSPREQARVSVVGHPEYGYTFTRPDGVFDLVVRGGGQLAYEVTASGLLPVSRIVDVPIGGYAFPGDVIPIHTAGCRFWTRGAGAQFVYGDLVKDKDGNRRGAMYLPSGLSASAGSTALDDMCISITERSSGPLGLESMPAALNPQSAYTYAVSFTVAGHESDRIDLTAGVCGGSDFPCRTPVYYVHNFIEDRRVIQCTKDLDCSAVDGTCTSGTCRSKMPRFPVGSFVPTGSLDEDAKLWGASTTGRVIKLLGVDSAGLARVDADGGGEDDAGKLAGLGIYTEELHTLGRMMTTKPPAASKPIFEPGAEVWRVPVSHFSSYDSNMGQLWPTKPGFPAARQPLVAVEGRPRCARGSVIECENAVLGESIPLNGAPFSLVYRSDRADGYRVPYSTLIPIAPDSEEGVDKLLRVEVQVHVLDVKLPKISISGAEAYKKKAVPIYWDGKTSAGYPTQGPQRAKVRLAYVYKPTYYGPATFGATGSATPLLSSGGSAGGGASATVRPLITPIPARNEIRLEQRYEITLGTFRSAGLGMGGWSIDKHHTWSNGKILFGSGGEASATDVTAVVARRTQGLGASFGTTPLALTSFGVTSDGILYGNSNYGVVRHAGGATRKLSLACAPALDFRTSLAVARNQVLIDAPGGTKIARNEIFVCAAGSKLYRLRDNGVDDPTCEGPLAGGGSGGAGSGDGGRATDAVIDCSNMIADRGIVYVSEGTRIRRIDVRANYIDRFAGGCTGTSCASVGSAADVAFATDVALKNPIQSMAAAPDGTVYIASAGEIRKVDPTGLLHLIAGGLGGGAPALGSPAIDSAMPGYMRLAVDDHGTLFVGTRLLDDLARNAIYTLKRDGIIRAFAQSAKKAGFRDGAPAANLWMSVVALAFTQDKDGDVLLAAGDIVTGSDPLSAVAGLVELRAPIGWSAEQVVHGDEIYVAQDGRHVQTLDATTGQTKWTFVYSTDGMPKLVAIRDASGNETRLLRDTTSGRVTRIIGPFAADGAPLGTVGVTELEYSGDRLIGVRRAPFEKYQLDYAPGTELLTMFAEPGLSPGGLLCGGAGSGAHCMTYDSDGRLLSDTAPHGLGSTTLLREQLLDGWRMTLTSALGRSRVYEDRFVDQKSGPIDAGTHYRTITAPDGAKTTISIPSSGVEEIATSSGTKTFVERLPDPRFGMQLPVGSTTVVLPSGKTRVVKLERMGIKPSPMASPSEITEQTEKVTLLSADGKGKDPVASGTFTRTLTKGAGGTWTHEVTSATTPPRKMLVSVDDKGRIVKVSYPGWLVDGTSELAEVRIGYDSRGRVETIAQGSGAAERVVTRTYDAVGVVSSVSANSPTPFATWFTSHDGVGRVLSQTLPGGAVVGTTFDPRGNVQTVMPPGRPSHVFTWTALDQVDSYTPPPPSSTAGSTGPSLSYRWNAEAGLEKVLFADPLAGDALQLQLGYDAFGRPESVLDGLSADTSFKATYDPATRMLSKLEWPLGAPSASLAFEYDGELLTRSTWSGSTWSPTATALEVRRDYDALFRLSALSAAGATTSFLYDADGLPTTIGDMVRTYRPGTTLLASTSLGVVTETFDHNGFGELRKQSAKAGSVGLLTIDYEPTGGSPRDKLGRIVIRDETIGKVGGGEETRRFKYEYDSAGRLSRVYEGTPSGAVSLKVEYLYDHGVPGNGNRTAKKIYATDGATVAKTESGLYDDQDRLTSYDGASYTYFATGEVKTKTDATGTTRYAWNARGSLLRVELPGGKAIDYLVDPLGRRVGKKVDGVLTKQWVWDGLLRVVGEVDVATGQTTAFVYGRHPNVPEYAVRDVGGVKQRYRIVTDHLGSVRLVVAATTGQIVKRIDYDEFGNVTNDTPTSGWSELPFGFAGGLYDRDTKLVRFGARDYDGQLGRWTAKDPSGFSDGSNLVAYAHNDPVNLVDFKGMGAEVVTLTLLPQIALGAITGALFEVGREIGVDRGRPLGEVFDLKQIGIAAAIGAGLGGATAPFFAVPETWITKSPFVGLISGYAIGRLQTATGKTGCAFSIGPDSE
ncbi:MAG: RHS repeat-associated core domain-containing protein [Deltaproteobacteria bacterium]|nr:RHS repeat-associated core domain-containing protein [Deltaproteobacteria bacterium]